MAQSAAVGPRQPAVRHDPRPRHIEGTPAHARLKNQRPDKMYRLADKAGRETGLPFYLSMGWETVYYEPGGVCFEVGQTAKKGEPLEYMGHVLVSIDKERFAEIERYGYEGDGGQEAADRLEDAIIDRRSGQADLLRGIGGPNYFRTVNQTRRTELEQPGQPETDPFGT